MRPVNLIPEEERGFHGGVARTGPFLHIVLGSLAVLLIGVVLLVLASNDVSDRESEITRLESQRTAVEAQASQLAPYVSFEGVAKARIENVVVLADSRFDWVRVIRQLSLILPRGTSIQHLTASNGAGSEGGSFAVGAPALNLVGCTKGQDETAAVVAAMKQIDGVTRVGLTKSALGGGEEGSGESECSAKSARFELTASFDEAATSSGAGTTLTEAAPVEAEGSTEEPASEESSGAASSSETAVTPAPETEAAG